MRMRRKKNRDARFEECIDYAVTNPAEMAGKWSGVFEKREAPLHAEIGCGKGGFIVQFAEREPDINFIAFEKCLDVLIMAMEKVKAKGLKNVKFVYGDAANLDEYFAEGELERIYLNFSDPWKKSGQYKRRLTYRGFLAKYKKVLKCGGKVWFKTDNRPLFDFSLQEFADTGCSVDELTFDLHNSEYNENNIMTEYEKNFSEKGFPINRCVVGFENFKLD